MVTHIVDRNGFFVEPDECVTCNCCHCEAPNNFRYANDGEGVTEVYAQPATPEELDGVFEAVEVCMVDCIYYGGTDPDIIRQLLDKSSIPNENVLNAPVTDSTQDGTA